MTARKFAEILSHRYLILEFGNIEWSYDVFPLFDSFFNGPAFCKLRDLSNHTLRSRVRIYSVMSRRNAVWAARCCQISHNQPWIFLNIYKFYYSTPQSNFMWNFFECVQKFGEKFSSTLRIVNFLSIEIWQRSNSCAALSTAELCHLLCWNLLIGRLSSSEFWTRRSGLHPSYLRGCATKEPFEVDSV